MKLIVSTAYIVVGLAVVSMAFNLMIEEMIEKFRWLGRKIGITSDERIKVGIMRDDIEDKIDVFKPKEYNEPIMDDMTSPPPPTTLPFDTMQYMP